MPYQQGYSPGSYGAYQGYQQQQTPPQAYMQQMSEVQYQNHHLLGVTASPRHVVHQTSQYQSTSPHPSQLQPQSQGEIAYLQHHYLHHSNQRHHLHQTQVPPQQGLSTQQNYYQPQVQETLPHQGYCQEPPAYTQPQAVYWEPTGAQSQQSRPQHRVFSQSVLSPAQQPAPTHQCSPLHENQHASRIQGQASSVHHKRPRRPNERPSAAPSQNSPPQPTPRQRTATHVAIPAQRRTEEVVEQHMPRSPKRRRSNEGNSIPVYNALLSRKPNVQQQVKPELPSSSPLTELIPSQMPPTPPPNVDYQAMLLSLADEYVAAAYKMTAALTSPSAPEEQLEVYHALLATAMGCLESVLINYRQSDPRREARIRLRLAMLLHEETENGTEAEEVLSKGIALCERSRLSDLKYAMHHLLSRVVFKSSPKAAVKSLEKLVSETEALNLMHWSYAFRFLRVTFGLQTDAHTDTASLLKHLAAISMHAESMRHIPVQIMAATFEAVVQLRSGVAEAVELARRALAAARMHQLGQEMQKLPQIRALLDCLDLALNVIHFSPEQAAAKLKQMHQDFDRASRDAGWHKDGSFLISVGIHANKDIETDTAGIFRTSESGDAQLTFCWLPQSQLYILGYLLSGLASMYKNSENSRAESFLQEGLKLSKVAPGPLQQSLAASTGRAKSQLSLAVAIRLSLAFAFAGRNDWLAAAKAVGELRKFITRTEFAVDQWTMCLIAYLEGMCKQGVGEIAAALDFYRSPGLKFETTAKASTALRDLQALATLNSILIMRKLSEPEKDAADSLLSGLESYCLQHLDKAFAAAFYVIKSTSYTPEGTIIKVKQNLQLAIQAGQGAANNQLLCVVMNFMTHLYFTNIVGEQAEKSARAGRTLAAKTKNHLWTAVADRLYGDKLELSGKHTEAAVARREAEDAFEALPQTLKENLQTMEQQLGPNS